MKIITRPVPLALLAVMSALLVAHGGGEADALHFSSLVPPPPADLNRAMVTFNSPQPGGNLVATVTLDKTADERMLFAAEIRECNADFGSVGDTNLRMSGYTSSHDICDSDAHASLDPNDSGRDFERHTIWTTSSRTVVAYYYIPTYQMITIERGQMSADAIWRTHNDGTPGTESLAVMVTPMTGSAAYKYHWIHPDTPPDGTFLSKPHWKASIVPRTAGAEVPPPAVSINIAGSGSEGDPVTFGIDATSLKPLTAPLPVNITLSGTGDILNASDAGWRTITIPKTGSFSLEVPTLDDNIQDNNTVTLTINPGDGYTLGLFSTWTVDVQDNDSPTQEQHDTPLTLEFSQAEQYTAVAIDPVLIANVTAMAAQTHHGHEHVDRWTRVLVAFGEVNGTNPMTAAEATVNSAKHSSPLWPQIADVLALLEAADAQQDPPQDPPQDPQQTPTESAIDPALISGVREQASQTHHGADHVDRWTRVLAAFGEVDHDNPMTAAEARANVEKYSSPLWPQIANILEAR